MMSLLKLNIVEKLTYLERKERVDGGGRAWNRKQEIDQEELAYTLRKSRPTGSQKSSKKDSHEIFEQGSLRYFCK